LEETLSLFTGSSLFFSAFVLQPYIPAVRVALCLSLFYQLGDSLKQQENKKYVLSNKTLVAFSELLIRQ